MKIDVRKYVRYFWYAVFGFVGIFFLMIILTILGAFGAMPSYDQLENPQNSLATEVYSADGVLLGKYYYQNRSSATFEEIPQIIKNALIATEDHRYYSHSGIDFIGLGRAAGSLGSEGGGSTITQQLAKNLFTKNVSANKVVRFFQKLKEWVVAVQLERRYTKDEILNLYFNTVEFSDNSFGIKSASTTYFNKIPDSLKIEEAAVLVGMLNGNTIYNPQRNPQNSLNRRNVVLAQMENNGFLTRHACDSLKRLPIKLNYTSPDHNNGVATYFREQMRLDLMNWAKKNRKPDGSNYDIYHDGLKIYSTINYRMQRIAEAAVAKHMAELQTQFVASYRGHGPWEKNNDFIMGAVKQSDRYQRMKSAGISDDSIMKVFNTKTSMTVFTWKGDRDTVMSPLDSVKYMKWFLQAGFMVMDPATGKVLAWVGGINFRYFKYDHVNINAKRQVGSAIKPILYASAIENGYSPCMQVPNERVVFEDFNNWSPENVDGQYGGNLTLYEGLAQSVNCVSAYLMKQIGPQPMIDLAQKMGITSKIPPYPSICLGTPDISVSEMVGAYSTFANKGISCQPYCITRIEDRRGNVIADFTNKKTQVLSEQYAYVMVRMLENVVNSGTAARLRFAFGLTSDLGGKTGTTQNNTDGWFLGITPQLVGGAWVGGSDRVIRFQSTFYGQGANMALPIWAYFLQGCYDDRATGISPDAQFQQPEGDMPVELDCDKYNQDNGTNDLIFGNQQN